MSRARGPARRWVRPAYSRAIRRSSSVSVSIVFLLSSIITAIEELQLHAGNPATKHGTTGRIQPTGRDVWIWRLELQHASIKKTVRHKSETLKRERIGNPLGDNTMTKGREVKVEAIGIRQVVVSEYQTLKINSVQIARRKLDDGDLAIVCS